MVFSFDELLHCLGGEEIYGKGRKRQEPAVYRTVLYCTTTVRLLYLAASVDIKRRIFKFIEPSTRLCEELPSVYRHRQEMPCPLKLGGMWVFRWNHS